MKELVDRVYDSTSIYRRGVDKTQLEEAFSAGANCSCGATLIENIIIMEEKLREAEKKRQELSTQNKHIVHTIIEVKQNVENQTKKRKTPTISTTKLLRVNSCPSIAYDSTSLHPIPLHTKAVTPGTPRFATIKDRAFGTLHQLMFKGNNSNAAYVPNTMDNL